MIFQPSKQPTPLNIQRKKLLLLCTAVIRSIRFAVCVSELRQGHYSHMVDGEEIEMFLSEAFYMITVLPVQQRRGLSAQEIS